MDGSILEGTPRTLANKLQQQSKIFFSEFNSWNWTEQYKLGKYIVIATQLVETKERNSRLLNKPVF
jgi:hypothetical protein